MHADLDDWNFNIWPIDEGFMQAESGAGGMTIYDLKIPKDAKFKDYKGRNGISTAFRHQPAQATWYLIAVTAWLFSPRNTCIGQMPPR